jgi:hypothetical protein
MTANIETYKQIYLNMTLDGNQDAPPNSPTNPHDESLRRRSSLQMDRVIEAIAEQCNNDTSEKMLIWVRKSQYQKKRFSVCSFTLEDIATTEPHTHPLISTESIKKLEPNIPK